MDFARKQMEKYGWKEGQGLGKNETGITNALKPILKNNNNGLGFDISEEFTNNWWDNLYKKASDNISVTETSGEVKLSQVGPDSVEISNSEYKISKGKKGVEQSFIKTSKIEKGNTIDFGVVIPIKNEVKLSIPTDEELFKACEGRTAHKGARHGFNLSGKMLRIEKQEKMLLKQMRRISLNEKTDVKVQKKCKKLEKLKGLNLDKNDDEKLSKKKKKKKRKSVSFSNAIAEVIPGTEADSSFNSEDRLGYESSTTGDPPHPPSPYPQSRSRSSSPLSLSSTSSPKLKQLSSRSSSPYPFSFNNTPPIYALPDEGIEQDFPPLDGAYVATTSKKSEKTSLGIQKSSAKSTPMRESEGEVILNDHRSFEERSDGFKVDGAGVGKGSNKGDALLSKAEKNLKMRKMRATDRFLAEILPAPINELDLTLKRLIERNNKRKKEWMDDTVRDNKHCKLCFKKSKMDKKQENVVNRIAKGLEKVCKITDGDEEKKKTKIVM